ncbi:MAG: enterochelin esterase [Renibacterium salmoninarum]|nr:enterochelin esterase [Renibacterium salmoninarum]
MHGDFTEFGLSEPAGTASFWQQAQARAPFFARTDAGWQALFLQPGEDEVLLRFDDRAEPVPMQLHPGQGLGGFRFAVIGFPAPFRVSYGFESADAPGGIADPLNPDGAGPMRSIAATPDAAGQPFWPQHAADALLPLPPIRLRWNSGLLGARRTVRMQSIGPEAAASGAVVFLLDGDDWIYLHPAGMAFEAAHRAGELPPCTLVFLPSPAGDRRREELALNSLFWQAVRDELLPLVAEQLGRPVDPASTVLAGQSYGGLAALFAAVTMPEVFRFAACQSGSFWYPAPADGDPLAGPAGGALGELIKAPADGPSAVPDLSGVTVAFDVGQHEGRMLEHQAEVLRLLQARGATVRSEFSAAGHDRSSWRSALLRDVAWLLNRAG